MARRKNNAAQEAQEAQTQEAAGSVEAEAAQAAMEKLKKQREDFESELRTAIESLHSKQKSGVEMMRLAWVDIGRKLNEGASLFMAGNAVNLKAYGDWLKEHQFNELGQRPTLAGARWLADTYDTNRDLYNLIPTETDDGKDAKTSPRTIQAWVRDQINEVFQNAIEEDKALHEGLKDEESAKKRTSRAKEAVGNIFEFQDRMIKMVAEQYEEVKGGTDYKKMAETRKRLDYLKRQRDILSHHSEEELAERFVKYKPKLPNVAFKDREVDDAAKRVLELLSQHPEMRAVYTKLGDLLTAHEAKMREEDEVTDDDEGEEVEEVDTDDEDDDIDLDDLEDEEGEEVEEDEDIDLDDLEDDEEDDEERRESA